MLLPAWLPGCLAACPSVRLKDRPPVRRFRAIAPPPLLGQCSASAPPRAIAPPPLGQCYCYCVRYRRQLRTSCAAPRYRLLAACFLCKLYFAHDCPTFPLHCLARASSKEDKRRTQLHGLERALFLHPTSTSALGRKNRHVVVEARKTTIFAHLPSIGLYLSRRPAAAANTAAAR